MDRLTRFSIIGSIISILLIIFKEDFYAEILAGLSLVIFCFILIYHYYKKNKIMCKKWKNDRLFNNNITDNCCFNGLL